MFSTWQPHDELVLQLHGRPVSSLLTDPGWPLGLAHPALPVLLTAAHAGRVTVTLLPRVCNITTLIIQILSSGVMPSIRSPSANVLRAAVNSCSLAAAVSGSAAASTGSCCSARLAALLSWNR